MIVAKSSPGHIWRIPGRYREDLAVSTTTHPYQRKVWAAIGPNFKSDLVLIDGYMDSDAYVNLLINSGIYETLEQAFGQYGYLFQQDNARPYTSNATVEAFTELDIPLLQGWPARSPDLSPIEMLWDLLKSRNRLEAITSPEDLDRALREALATIDIEKVNHYVDSFLTTLTVCA
jgi:hypothetical protein